MPECEAERRNKMAQEPAGLSEWEIAARRAIFECDQQLTDGNYNINRIRHILADAERN